MKCLLAAGNQTLHWLLVWTAGVLSTIMMWSFFVVVERVRNKSTDNKSGIRLENKSNIFWILAFIIKPLGPLAEERKTSSIAKRPHTELPWALTVTSKYHHQASTLSHASCLVLTQWTKNFGASKPICKLTHFMLWGENRGRRNTAICWVAARCADWGIH